VWLKMSLLIIHCCAQRGVAERRVEGERLLGIDEIVPAQAFVQINVVSAASAAGFAAPD